MARGVKVITEDILRDDLDGTAVESPDELFRIFVGYNGDVYQIDVSRKNMNAFSNAVKKYVTAAGKADIEEPGTNVKHDAFLNDKGFTSLIGIRKSGTTPTVKSEHSEWLARVRQWAQQNGRDISNRGRLAADIKAAYKVVHPEDDEPADD